MVLVMLAMGVASPLWMRAIDTAGTAFAEGAAAAGPSAKADIPAGPKVIQASETLFTTQATEARK
jgi:hypothetical protein